MKKFIKLIALSLALIMTLALTPTAFAADAEAGMTVVTIGDGGDYATYSAAVTAIGCDNLDGYYLKQVSDIVETGNVALSTFTKSATLVLDGNGYGMVMTGGMVVGAKDNKTNIGAIDVTIKNVSTTKPAGTVNNHPLVYARACADVTLENCYVDETYTYAIAGGYYNGKITVESGTYKALSAPIMASYGGYTAVQEFIINGGTFELVESDTAIGLVNSARQIKDKDGRVTKTGSAYKLTINDGCFIVNGQAKGEVMFNTFGKCDITINGGIFIAKNAITTYLWEEADKITINDGIFWQNVRYPIIMEREKTTTVDINGGVFYSPDYRLYDGKPDTEQDDLVGQLNADGSVKNPNNNTMGAVDGVHAPGTGASDWKCTIDGAKFYYTVSDNVGIVKTVGDNEIYATPTAHDQNAVVKLQHSSMCGKVAITPVTVAADAVWADLYVNDSTTLPVAIDQNINTKTFEGAIIYLTEDYDGPALEITRNLTVETNGFDKGELKAGGDACIRNGLEGTKMYVQYTGLNRFGQFSARIVFSVSSVDYRMLGMHITSNKNGDMVDTKTGKLLSGVSDISITKCYESIVADGQILTAKQLGGKYIIAVEITDLDVSCLGKTIYFNVYGLGYDGSVSDSGVRALKLPTVIGG